MSTLTSTMLPPWLVDGCTLVILLQSPSGFVALYSGELRGRGQSLTLLTATSERPITPEELAAFELVSEHRQIPECQGYDFFLIDNS